jgi:hypothetical protein
MMITKEELSKKLQKKSLSITFTKVDGSERVMNCTLEEKFLPVVESKSTKKRLENQGVISVFDLDKQAWRSIRLDSIKSVC